MKRIMIDLETLDTAVTAAIVSIGAVCFDELGARDESFYRAVQYRHEDGRTMSRETLAWWLQQSAEVQFALADPNAVALAVALGDLELWVKSVGADPDPEVWAGPATFDLAILQHAYQQAGRPTPWAYNETRCYTTLRKLFPHVQRPASAIPHNAREDARAQAQHAVQLLFYRDGEGHP